MMIEHSSKFLRSTPSETARASRFARRGPTGSRAAVGVVASMMVGALLAFVPAQAGAQGHFSDTAHHWGHDGINHLMDIGVLGDANSTWCGPSEFCPDNPTQRWMAAVWLVRALNGGQDPAPVSETSFSDIAPDAFWAPHIEFLASLGLALGYPDGEYKPFRPVTRRQLNVFMARGLNLEAFAANAAVLKHGAFVVLHSCHDGGIDCPHEPVSRGESAAMLSAGLKGHLDTPPTAAPEGIFWDIDEGISAGDYHTCALYHSGRLDDRLVCWGLNPHGQLDNPNPEHWKYRRVAAGGSHTCAIRLDNRIDCWGLNTHGQTDVPDGSYKNVAAGATNTCAIRTNHHLVCWGKADNGINDNVPEYAFDNLDVGTDHACAIRRGSNTDGNRKRLYCWGDDSDRETSRIPRHYPNRQNEEFRLEGRHYFGVTAGHNFTCAAIYERGDIKPAGRTLTVTTQYRQCWGANDRLQAPNRPEPNVFPTERITDVQIKEHMIDAGWWHACAITSGYDRRWCWGDNTYGQFDGDPDAKYRSITSGAVHACAVKSDRSIDCWGFDL